MKNMKKFSKCLVINYGKMFATSSLITLFTMSLSHILEKLIALIIILQEGITMNETKMTPTAGCLLISQKLGPTAPF